MNKFFTIGIFAGLLSLVVSGCDTGTTEEVGASTIHVTSTPASADIYLYGKKVGSTPGSISNLTKGNYLVELRKTGFEPARKSISVFGGQEASLDFEKLEPVTGLVLIHSEPPGASVEIAGAHRGDTPLMLPDIALGEHRVMLTYQGYLSKEVILSVENRRPIKIKETLKSNSAVVTFSSTPAGASVIIDGIMRGTTPCTINNVQTGQVKIAMKRKGYFEYKEEVSFHSGDTYDIDAPLKPIPGGLRVVTEPPNAKVYLNNQFKGEAPVELGDLVPGDIRVRVELKGYATDSRTISIDNGSAKVEEFRMVKNSGMLEIVTQPSGVTVFVDGEEVGVTTVAAGASDAISDPIRVDLLNAGPHRVQLIKKGFLEVNRKVNVTPEEISPVRVKLERIFIPDYLIVIGDKPDDQFTGRLVKRFENGDVRLEVRPGIEQTFTADKIISQKPLKTQQTP